MEGMERDDKGRDRKERDENGNDEKGRDEKGRYKCNIWFTLLIILRNFVTKLPYLIIL